VDTSQKPASAPIRTQHEQMRTSLPMDDEQDFADARRGLLGALTPGVVERSSASVTRASCARPSAR
jgi:alkyl sulfatase BDS1-like metallo-beta-lactamase superfamily hydrolase